MKHLTFIIAFLLFCTLSLPAQEYSPCYTNNMAKGEAAYKQGKYSEAKTYYVNAKKCNGGNPTAAQQKINSCDAKIKAQQEAAEAKRRAEQEAAEERQRMEEEARRKAEQEAAEAKRKAEIQALAKTYTVNGVSFTMKYVEGGTFTMGCTSEQGGDCEDDETPIHSITLSDFLIGETEVTQALWEAVMGTTVREQRDKANPFYPMQGEGASYPMYYVSWNEAVEFCNKLNEKLRNQLPSGCRFALPTEAQWEYAARGGNKSQHYKYAGSNTLGNVAWYEGNSSSTTHPVKGKQANELGLYDMSGNVYEWCSDWKGNYNSSTQTNPKGPSSGSDRVLRGGSWGNYAKYCRVSSRGSSNPDNRIVIIIIGFRLSLVP